MPKRDIAKDRLTTRDEYGNADIIGVDSANLQLPLAFEEMNLVTRALNRLAAYEDSGLTPKDYISRTEAAEKRVAELEGERDEALAACAELRGVAERVKGMCELQLRVGPFILAVDAYQQILDKVNAALSSSAGKDLLERLEKAESIIKRTAQDRHRLIRNAACKQCKEFPCEGDDRVLCIHKNLMTDIDAFLKGGGKDA